MRWTHIAQYRHLEKGFWKHLHNARVAWIVNRIARERDRRSGSLRMLDVGCGDGIVTKRLRAAFPDAAVWAVDLDSVRLVRAKAYCADVAFCHGDVARLPFVTGSFEVVLCHHVVEHVPDDIGVLVECRRVLVPGGLLIVGIPQEGAWPGRIVRTLHQRLYARGEHVNFYTLANMRERLRDAGFSDIEHAKFGFLFPHYYVHVLLVWNRFTFALGHWISRWFDATADSLIFAGRKQA